ncbi:hypothetical protein P389DRAFT_207595 [Cystobasidium minutum MCA 4210]|uniref:uncharacterized protein n=1 Tax=Cystobasidium minutum MCA 4210 TaxID=1397322 RepID=UPI0034CD97DB|eukprot:jgi/Rhomi1/207595/estExt_Genemark1.C_1_t20023
MKLCPLLSPPSSALMVLALPLLAQSVSAVALLGDLLRPESPTTTSSSSLAPTPSTASETQSGADGTEGNWGGYRGWKKRSANVDVDAAAVNLNMNNADLLKRDEETTTSVRVYGGEGNWGMRPWKRDDGEGESTITTTATSTVGNTGVDGVEGNWPYRHRGWAKRDDGDGQVGGEGEGTASVSGVEGNWPGFRGCIKKREGEEVGKSTADPNAASDSGTEATMLA